MITSLLKRALFGLLLILCTAGNIAAQEVLYYTGFNDKEEKWPATSIPGGNTTMEEGFYVVKKFGREEVFITNDLKLDYTRNFTIETAVKNYNGSGTPFGLVIGFKDKENFLPFAISNSGGFFYSDVKNGKPVIPNERNNAPGIKRGNAINLLKIEKSGNTLFFYINDVIVGEKEAPEFLGNEVGFVITNNQLLGFDYLRVKYIGKSTTLPKYGTAKPPVTPSAQVKDVTPPIVTLVSPMVPNAGTVTKTEKELRITGRATDLNGIFSVFVNDTEAIVDEQGKFTATIPLVIGKNAIEVVATDGKMNISKFAFTAERRADATRTVNMGIVADEDVVTSPGKYYALLIGVQDYTDPAINDLEKPLADATLLYNVLTTGYTFNKPDVLLLKNPTRDKLFETLDELSRKVKPEDNLLIFYAGHGYWDDVRKQGYWYPVDAKKTIRSNWISNADLKEAITSIPSKHTLLVTDACFSGGIFKTRAVLADATKAIQELYNLPSRKAMTSGALKEVPDNSVFIAYLVKRLKENKQKYLSAGTLFSSFREAVTNNSTVKQIPQYGEIREAGDEGGEFIFIRKQ